MKIDIRELGIDDLSIVYHLGEELFTSEDAPFLYRTWDEFEVTEYFTTDPEFCLVVEIDDEIVGFIFGTIMEKPGTAWKYGYVAWIGIKKSHQGTHIGRRLYEELEKRMMEEGVRMMIADTEGSNKTALEFFRKSGFAKTKTHIWMAKVLHKKTLKNKGVKKVDSDR